MAKPTKKIKDLTPKSAPVKGGSMSGHNDNMTLVRAAKPGKKDLPPSKDVKGGGKKIV